MHRNRLALFGALAGLAFGLAMPAAAHPMPPGGMRGPPMLPVAMRAHPMPQGPRPFVLAPEMMPPQPVFHRAHDAQNEARREMRAGNIHSVRDIERQVLPTMRGMQYLGPEYDPDAMAYRLKFIRDGRVMFVDVDARTGIVRGRTR